jgi:uncharacterized protein YprB with RNaseH-like and TPR domain
MQMASDPIPQKGDPILFFDVETLPCEKDNALWKKVSSTVEREEDESEEQFADRLESLRRDTSLYGTLGRAWMIGVADRMEEPLILRSDGSVEMEKALLESLWAKVSQYENPWWVGHNVMKFDIPFLQVRALHHGMQPLARHLSRDRVKPWDARVLDTMQIWPRTGKERGAWRDGLRSLAGLDSICHVLGIPLQEGVMGSEVYQCWLDGRHDEVAEHLDQDIRQVREVFRTLWHIL